MLSSELGIKRYLYVQRIIVQSIGMDINTSAFIFRRPLLAAFLLLLSILEVSSMGHYCWLHRHNMDEFTDSLLPLSQTLLCYWKIAAFLYNNNETMLLVQHLMSMSLNATKQERSIIAAENKIDRNLSGAYYLIFLFEILLISLAPHVVGAIIYIQTGQFSFVVPFKLSTPFDQDQSFWYIVTNLWIPIAVFFAVSCSLVVDTFFSWLVHNVVAQFRILQLQLANAATKTDAFSVDVAIRNCIAHHQSVTKVAHSLDIVYRPVIFMQFTLSSIQICFYAFLLARGGASQRIPYLIFSVILQFMNFMIYCYGGQRVQDESQRVGTQLYEVIPWHRTSVPAKKLLLLFLMRAQKECYLTGTFFVSNWALFIKVVTQAYSYFALLWTLVKQENTLK